MKPSQNRKSHLPAPSSQLRKSNIGRNRKRKASVGVWKWVKNSSLIAFVEHVDSQWLRVSLAILFCFFFFFLSKKCSMMCGNSYHIYERSILLFYLIFFSSKNVQNCFLGLAVKMVLPRPLGLYKYAHTVHLYVCSWVLAPCFVYTKQKKTLGF